MFSINFYNFYRVLMLVYGFVLVYFAGRAHSMTLLLWAIIVLVVSQLAFIVNDKYGRETTKTGAFLRPPVIYAVTFVLSLVWVAPITWNALF